MNRNTYKFLIFFTSLLTLMASCNKKEDIAKLANTLKFVFQYSDGITKSPIPINEGEINDINIFLYNEKGMLVHSTYIDNPSLSMELEVASNRFYSIYVIANSGDLTKSEATVRELYMKENYITYTSILSRLESNGTIPMSGHIPLMEYSDNDEVNISLTRVLSKFRFILNKEGLSPTVTKFDISEVKLRNINNKIFFFSESRATSSEDILDIGGIKSGEELTDIYTNGIDFYIPENMQGNLLAGNTDEKGHIPPDEYIGRCSYIEYLVDYISNEAVDEELTYRYFLHDGRLLDNFDIVRNRMYTCTTNFIGSGINESSWRIETSSLKKIVTSIKVSPKNHTFTSIGETKQFYASLLPLDAEDNSARWSSSNTDVATVDNYGRVTSVGDGTCTITATANDLSGLSDNATVIVDSYIFPSSVEVTPSSCSIYTGEKIQLSATVLPSNCNNKGVTWSSSNTSVATVSSSGIVTAHNGGNCLIYATTIDKNITSSSHLTVTEKKFDIEPIPILYPNYNTPFTVVHSATPDGVPTYTLQRISGEESLSISSDVLTAYYYGSAQSGMVGQYILVGELNGIRKEMVASVNIGSISISTPGTMISGESKYISILGKSPSNSSVSWSSDNPAVATVDNNGKISALKGGSAHITAKLSTGGYSTVLVEVIEPYINLSISGDKLMNSNISTNVTGYPMTQTLTAEGNSTGSIEWIVYNEKGDQLPSGTTFQISSQGEIKALGTTSGTYIIKAKSGNTYSNEVPLKVYLYLEYDLSIDLHSYDKAKDEIMFDYQVSSKWRDESWNVLKRNSEWIYNFCYEPKYQIIKIDNAWGYSFISDPYNDGWPISSIFSNYYPYDREVDDEPENHPERYINIESVLKDPNGNTTARGNKGIAIEDGNYGYFYIRKN